MEIFITIVFVLVTLFAVGQEKSDSTLQKKKRPVKTSLLSNYYEQDGKRSAVNGGVGSQELYSYTQEVAIYVPVKDSSAYKISAGVDNYTAASLMDIDKYKTSASTGKAAVSKDETRIYGGLGFDFANKPKNSVVSPSVGFSKEYDVMSFSAGYSYAKFFPKKEATFISAVNFIADRWMMVFPGEFRPQETTNAATTNTLNPDPDTNSGASRVAQVKDDYPDEEEEEDDDDDDDDDDDYPVVSADTIKPYAVPFNYDGRKTMSKDGKTYPIEWRYSYAWTNFYGFAINKRMNAGVGLDLIMQRGMLSTPFHRVYFRDGVTDEYQKEVRIEKLPSIRLKAALSGRFNYFVHPLLIVRTDARLYIDNWGIKSFSAGIELPVKITRSLCIAPFYRYHQQSASDYFKGYGRHVYADDRYYTSDFDLAQLSAHKLGGLLRFAPFKPMGISNESNTRKLLAIQSLGLRYAGYVRSDGLSASMVTVELNLEF